MFESTIGKLLSSEQAVVGRKEPLNIADTHFVNGRRLDMQLNYDMETAMFGMGCFWGAEKCFWVLPGVYLTSVGYSGGYTDNPTYQEVCSGMTGHNEVVRVVFNRSEIKFDDLLKVFWESHNPTEGMQQGNDRGTQYRSGIYCYSEGQHNKAVDSAINYQRLMLESGYGEITTEVIEAPTYYFAEDYHQQYLAKNPNGYCGLGGTGVSLSVM